MNTYTAVRRLVADQPLNSGPSLPGEGRVKKFSYSVVSGQISSSAILLRFLFYPLERSLDPLDSARGSDRHFGNHSRPRIQSGYRSHDRGIIPPRFLLAREMLISSGARNNARLSPDEDKCQAMVIMRIVLRPPPEYLRCARISRTYTLLRAIFHINAVSMDRLVVSDTRVSGHRPPITLEVTDITPRARLLRIIRTWLEWSLARIVEIYVHTHTHTKKPAPSVTRNHCVAAGCILVFRANTESHRLESKRNRTTRHGDSDARNVCHYFPLCYTSQMESSLPW